MNNFQYNQLVKSECLKKCKGCSAYRPIENYYKQYRNNEFRILLYCVDCRNRYKCEEHGKQKNRCIKCDGNHICPHHKLMTACKECYDPMKILIRNMLFNSKRADKDKDRYDPVHFVDKSFIKNLIEDQQSVCYICKNLMQYINYDKDLCTLERLDNSIGHNKSNCVLACKDCNTKNLGHK